jgi:hypothetical protein
MDDFPFEDYLDPDQSPFELDNLSLAVPLYKKKDPMRPRGYMSAFNYFQKANRPRIAESLAANSTEPKIMLNKKINKEIGQEWKTLSPSQRKEYEALAVRDKARYLADMQLYKPTCGYERAVPRYVPL